MPKRRRTERIRTREDFAKSMLKKMGLRASANRKLAFVVWMSAENTEAAYNPLATTMPAEGATNFNSVGVKNYVSYRQGVNATYKTLALPYYDALRQGFKHANSAKEILEMGSKALETWGTGDLVFAVFDRVQKDYGTYAATVIPNGA